MESESELGGGAGGGGGGRKRMEMPFSPSSSQSHSQRAYGGGGVRKEDEGSPGPPTGGTMSPGSYHRGLAIAHSAAGYQHPHPHQHQPSPGDIGGREEETVQNGVGGETLMERFRRQSASAGAAGGGMEVTPLVSVKMEGGVEGAVIQG